MTVKLRLAFYRIVCRSLHRLSATCRLPTTEWHTTNRISLLSLARIKIEKNLKSQKVWRKRQLLYFWSLTFWGTVKAGVIHKQWQSVPSFCWVAGKCCGTDCSYWSARHQRVRDPQHCHLKWAENPNWPVIKCLRLYKAAPGENAFSERGC